MPSNRRTPNSTPPLIYIDSSVYMDLITAEQTMQLDTGDTRGSRAAALFTAVEDGQARVAASALIEAEVGCNGISRNGDQRVRDLLRAWFTAPSTRWMDVDRFLARDAIRLVQEHAAKRSDKAKTFGAADATHLAAAIRLGCDYLFAQDGGFPMGHEIEGVRVMRPQVVWPETLFDTATG